MSSTLAYRSLFFCPLQYISNLRTDLLANFPGMSRRAHSTSPSESPRLSKRPKLEHLMSQDFKGGVFLAPMVRSGACTSLNVTVLYILPEFPRSTYPFVRFKARRRLSLGP